MSIQIPEEQNKAWREEFQKWWFLDHNDTSEINRAYAWAAWLSSKTSSYEREQDNFERAMYLEGVNSKQANTIQKLQERIEELEEELKDEIENDTSISMAKTYIDHLESQLAKRDQLIDHVKDWIIHGNINSTVKIQVWLKQAEELKVEK